MPPDGWSDISRGGHGSGHQMYLVDKGLGTLEGGWSTRSWEKRPEEEDNCHLCHLLTPRLVLTSFSWVQASRTVSNGHSCLEVTDQTEPILVAGCFLQGSVCTIISLLLYTHTHTYKHITIYAYTIIYTCAHIIYNI